MRRNRRAAPRRFTDGYLNAKYWLMIWAVLFLATLMAGCMPDLERDKGFEGQYCPTDERPAKEPTQWDLLGPCTNTYGDWSRDGIIDWVDVEMLTEYVEANVGPPPDREPAIVEHDYQKDKKMIGGLFALIAILFVLLIIKTEED